MTAIHDMTAGDLLAAYKSRKLSPVEGVNAVITHIEKWEPKLKALYAPRLDACLAAIDKYIPDAVTTRPDGGFFLSLTLPEGVSTTAVRAAAARVNLNLADGLAFFPQGGGERFLRLPFCALSAAQIDEGVRRLAVAVQEARS